MKNMQDEQGPMASLLISLMDVDEGRARARSSAQALQDDRLLFKKARRACAGPFIAANE
jgi:hypothetical protein